MSAIRWSFVLAAIVVGGAASAQSIQFERYPQAELTGCGLGGENAENLLVDRRGFLWCWTRSALMRYDGHEVKRYAHDAADSNSIGAGKINEIYEDRAGYIWISYYLSSASIDRLDPTTGITEHVLTRDPSVRLNSRYDVTGFLEDSQGYIWFSTWGGGIGRVEPDTWSVTYFGAGGQPVDCPMGAHVGERGLYEDHRGRVWVRSSPQVYRPNELCRFDPATKRWDHFQLRLPTEHGEAPASVSFMAEDGAGRFWTGSSEQGLWTTSDDGPMIPEGRVEGAGLFYFDLRRQAFLPAEADSTLPETLNCSTNDGTRIGCSISLLATDRQGRLWIGSDHGRVTRYDGVSSEVVHLVHDPANPYSAPEQAAWALEESPDGTIWLSADGLYRSRPNAGLFETAYLDLNAYSIAGSATDSLWVTGSLGIYKVPGSPVGPGNHVVDIWNVFDAHPLPSGDLLYGIWWIPEVRGFLYRLDEQTARPTRLHAWSDSTVISAIEVDLDGTIWLGTRGRGLMHMRPDDWTYTRFRHDPENADSLAGDLVAAILADDSGALWIGSDRGLQRYERAQGVFETITRTTHEVASIARDRSGSLWLGTTFEGVVQVDIASGATRRYGIREGMPTGRIGHVAVDDFGIVWASTARGISRLEPDTETIRNFYPEDGTLEDGYVSNHALHTGFARGRDGSLYFGGLGGLTRVFPDRFVKNAVPPNVVVDEILLFDQPLRPGPDSPLVTSPQNMDEVVFAHDENDLTIRFAVLHFGAPEQNKVHYILEGLDEDWIDAGTERRARYADLRPGTYTFRVKAANSDGVWNEEGASIGIVVLPPWWQTWWAYGIYLVVLLVAATAAYRWRTGRLRRRALELAEQVRLRTRELAEEKAIVEEQAARLIQLEQTKDRFFANISHEFRTPLTLILGPLQDLLSRRDGDLDPGLARQLGVIRRSGLRMKRLIDQLLDLTKLEVGRLTLRPRELEVVSFVRDVVLSFSALADRRRIRLTFHSDVERVAAAMDPDKVEKIVANLVSNAMKFTDQGGQVAVRVICPEADQAKEVEFRVIDSGKGIPSDELPHVFDRFYQAANNDGVGEVGTGIGLALSKELVELHGGAIFVSSEVGFGSTFTVRLPLDLEPVDVDGEAEETEGARLETWPMVDSGGGDGALLGDVPGGEGEESVPLPDATVLVVEDNDDLRAYIRGHLERLCAVEEACDGVEGLEKARALRPDLILTDVMMPRLDGVELCRAIKAEAELRHIPVVMLTAKATDQAKIEGLRAGADDYIVKPFSAEALEARIENLIVIRRELLRQDPRYAALEPDQVEVASDEEVFMKRAKAVVEAHMADEHFTAEFFADEMAMSVRQLQRRLKRATNLTPAGYVRMMRLKRAAQLLRSGIRSVSEVAHRVGYTDVSHFSRLFHQMYGVPPSEYGNSEREQGGA